VQFVVRPPSPVLAPFVQSIWYFSGELAHARELVLPSGAMQLLVNLDEDELRSYVSGKLERRAGAAVCGAFARPIEIDTAQQRAICGVSFKPGGAFPFFSTPASELAESHVELDVLWGRDGATVRERLLDAGSPQRALACLDRLLISRAVRSLSIDHTVQAAVEDVDAGSSIGAITDRLGLTPRTFIARFGDAVGLTPKRFARVRRFRRLLDAIDLRRPTDWARAAYTFGYSDQSHLIHEFRAFAAMSPTAYRPRSEGDRTHVALREPQGERSE
jgi:AraC-like DNA-binding protein